ncbi:Uncharacterised protein [uncultured Clostridium sp.]|nr:Uncharacterised protein [uncultured Clostridium sp.]SCJ09434.1 Uncharacterised protein [uncultured Clostridium sp.]
MYVLLILYLLLINISIITPKKYIKILIIIFSIVIGIISFLFVPVEDMDLFRHYQRLEILRNINLSELNNTHIYDSLPVIKYYLFFISKLKYNGFLPAITIFIIYFLMGLIIHKFSKSNNLSKKAEVFLYLFFILTHNYLTSISGIRNFMAFSIFFYVLYMDLVEGKKKLICFSIYIILCFIHTSVIILIVIRLILFIRIRFLKKIVVSLILVWSFFIPVITTIFTKFERIEFFRELIYKMSVYNNIGITINIHSILATILLIIAILIICISTNILNVKEDKPIYTYLNYAKLLCIFIIGSINNYHVFIRFSNSLTFVIPIILGVAINNKLTSYKKVVVLCITILLSIVSIGLFIFQYKFISFK